MSEDPTRAGAKPMATAVRNELAERSRAKWVNELRRQASSEKAVRALERYSDGGWGTDREVSIAAGAASEYLHAALLVAVDPVLIADPRSLDSMIMLSRHNQDWKIRPLELRTADMNRKMDILGKVFPSALRIRPDADFVARARNAAVHAGLAAPKSADAVMQHLVRVVDALDQLVPSPRRFWPPTMDGPVDKLRAEASTAVTRLLEVRLARARVRYRLLTDGIRGPVLEDMLQARERAFLSRAPSLIREFDCPACRRRGWVSYTRALAFKIDERDEVVGEGEAYGAAIAFDCSVCGLTLEGETLGEYATFSAEIELSDDEAIWGTAELVSAPDVPLEGE